MQDLQLFAEGVDSIVEAETRVALQYFEDGSVEGACPPLRALLHIMAYGSYQSHTVESPEVRALFTREALIESDWYAERRRTKQSRDIALWTRHVAALEKFLAGGGTGLDIELRLTEARRQLARVSACEYLEELTGTIGADPFRGQMPAES
jgi:hypothetical protein